MSDRIKRIICRGTFVLFCVAPTLLVLYCVFLPTTKSSWEKSVANHLGLRATIEKIQTPRPGTTHFKNLKIRLASGNQWNLSQIEFQRQRGTCVFSATADALPCESIAFLARSAIDRLSSSSENIRAGHITFDSLTIHHTQNKTTDETIKIYDVDIRVLPSGTGWSASVEFKMETSKDDSILLQMDFDRPVNQSKLKAWSLNTGQTPVPVLLISSILPEARMLGPNAKFVGNASAEMTPQGMRASLQGDLLHANLFSLVELPLGPVLQGQANFRQLTCKIENGKIQTLSGIVVCREGTIGSDLLAALDRWPNLSTRPNPNAQSFRDLQLQFFVRESTVYVGGIEQSNGQRIIASDALQQPLIWQDGQRGSLALSTVLKTIVQQPAVEIPVTPHTLRLLTWFAPNSQNE
jgi:hypothetical protein